MTRPSVRVVIPCFNHGRFVREAVASACAQDDAETEIVVVDDGSDDRDSAEACEACSELGATVIHQENRGLPAARNRGAAGASTEYLAFLDADDLLLPGFTRDLAAAIRAEVEAGSGDDVSHAYGQQQVTGLVEMVWKVPSWDPILEMITNLHPPTALIRRAAFERAGGYSEDMREGYEDWDFWIRCIASGYRGVRVARPVYVWRRHDPESMLHRASRMHEELYRRIVAHHEALYRSHALEIMVRVNRMLQEGGATWLDEDLEPIHLQNTQRHLAEVIAERDSAQKGLEEARRRAEVAEEETQRVRRSYEAKPAIRISRAFYRGVDRLPRPAASALRGLAGVIKKLAPPAH